MDITIRELVETIIVATGRGQLERDTTKLDRTPRKHMDVTRLADMG